MEYSGYPGNEYAENHSWARWVWDNMKGNIPGGGMPDPPVPREDPYNPRTNLETALITIRDATEGETEDKAFYEYLISVAPTQEDRDIIAGIRDDEMKHYRMFRQMYYDITGEVLPPAQAAPFETPASYCAGLKKALLGEQSAVARYRKVLFAMRDRRHINMITEIITDELRHLGLYNYLYSKNGCGT